MYSGSRIPPKEAYHMALEFASRPEDIGPLLRAERKRRHWPLKKVAAE